MGEFVPVIPDSVKWQLYKDDLANFPGYDGNGEITDQKLALKTRISLGSGESAEPAPEAQGE